MCRLTRLPGHIHPSVTKLGFMSLQRALCAEWVEPSHGKHSEITYLDTPGRLLQITNLYTHGGARHMLSLSPGKYV